MAVIAQEQDQFSLVRYTFDDGVGYEYLFTDLLEADEQEAILMFHAGTQLRYLTTEAHGWSENGYALTRMRAWLDDRYL